MTCLPSIQNFSSSLVLGSGKNTTTATEDLNSSVLAVCGANFCPSDGRVTNETSSNFETDITRVYILAGVFLICSIIAPILVAVLADPLST